MNAEEDGTLSYSFNYRERGVMKMYQLVQENPHLEVPQIYNSVRQELSELFQGGAEEHSLLNFHPTLMSHRSFTRRGDVSLLLP